MTIVTKYEMGQAVWPIFLGPDGWEFTDDPIRIGFIKTETTERSLPVIFYRSPDDSHALHWESDVFPTLEDAQREVKNRNLAGALGDE